MPIPPTPVVLAAAVRTPIGRFGGGLAGVAAPDLGAAAVRASLERAGLAPDRVSEVVFGNARAAGVGPNPARQVAMRAGIPAKIPAYTINQACGSGLRAIVNAVQAVALGDSEIVVAGGCESMSRVPYLLTEARWGRKLGHGRVVDAMYQDGFLCPLCSRLMGETAETLADQYAIGREAQDLYAARSQQRAEAARRSGRFAAEIVPVGDLTADEHPRDGVTVASLARLEPVFRSGGTVHAGNSSGITDGAASVLVMRRETAQRLSIRPLAEVRAYTSAGVDPEIMGIGPVPAVRALLEGARLAIGDIDLVELNEAFAVQVLACARDLGLDEERLNVNGGAIALGHPIGATGARIVVTLLHEMERRRARRGLATLCVSGGMGLALLVERAED